MRVGKATMDEWGGGNERRKNGGRSDQRRNGGWKLEKRSGSVWKNEGAGISGRCRNGRGNGWRKGG